MRVRPILLDARLRSRCSARLKFPGGEGPRPAQGAARFRLLHHGPGTVAGRDTNRSFSQILSLLDCLIEFFMYFMVFR